MNDGEQDAKNSQLSSDMITEASLDLTPGITEHDKLLWKKEKNAVDFSLNYVKLYSKFCKDLVVTLEKKASIENDAHRSLAKLFQGLESNLASNSMIGSPVRTETINMCKLVSEQCKEVEHQNSKKVGKLLDAITRQRNEVSKTRKHYKDKWKSDCKRMMDAENTMIKTRTAYYQRCQQGVKLREELTTGQSMLNYMRDHGDTAGPISTTSASSSSATSTAAGSQMPQSGGIGNAPNFESYGSASGNLTAAGETGPVSASQMGKQKAKVDKLEKLLADNDKKEIEQMYSYKESVESANHRLVEFEKKKLEHLCDIRLTTMRSDEIVKDMMADFVKIISESRISMLKEYGVLGDKFQEYRPCQEYRVLIDKQTHNKPDSYAEKFQVELFHDSAAAKEKSESQISKSFSRFAALGLGKDADHDSKNRGMLHSHSDSDSEPETSTGGGGSADTGGGGARSTGVLNTIVEFGSNLFTKGGESAMAGGGGGAGGGQAGAGGKTKKSTSGSTSSMGPADQGPLGSASSGDRVESEEWIKEVTIALEQVLSCICAIEAMPEGLATHGIYRVSASKSRVATVTEALAQDQSGAGLENESPITLASAVKSRLIALSEPLVPYMLYTEFVELGKEAEVCGAGDTHHLVIKLNALIQQLPAINKKLAGLLFHHLKKVANNAEENQMGSTNLGTLFAPTLIKTKPRFRNVDIKEYMDNKSQAKIVQVIIENVDILFGPEEQYYNLNFASENAKEDSTPASGSGGLEPTDSTKRLTSRPQSTIIESSTFSSLGAVTTQTGSTEAGLSRLNTGSLRVPKPGETTSVTADTTAIGTGGSSPHSPRVRERRANHAAAAAATEAENHRSVSTGSGPLPADVIKLATLSQPATDSIFSKKNTISSTTSTTSSNTPVGDRSIHLKKSFISSGSSASTDSHDPSSTSSKVTEQKRASALRSSSQYGSSSSGNKSSSTAVNNQHNFSSSFSPPDEVRTRSQSHCCPGRQPLQPSSQPATKTRAFSHAPQTPGSPFIRQSHLRMPLSVRSNSELHLSHTPRTTTRLSRLHLFRSADCLVFPVRSGSEFFV